MIDRVLRSSIATLIAALALAGCDACGSGPPVPFGLDAGRARGRAIESPPRRGPDAPSPGESLVARELPEGTSQVEIEGAALALEGEGMRALGATDVDGDGDRDVLVVSGGNATRGARVLFVSREGPRFAAPSELASLPALASGCAIEHARVAAIAEGRVAIEVMESCAGEPRSGATHAVVLGMAQRPRLLERFALRSHAQGESAALADRLALRAEDRDGDGIADLVADIAVQVTGAAAPAEVSLVFLDRPAGLARDEREPEARIAALAQEARSALRRQPARARELASSALALWETICREAGHATLEIGGAQGAPCGRSGGAGRALAVLAPAAARTGDPLLALDAIDRLGRAQVSVRDAERGEARSALDGLGDPALALNEGPAIEPPHERGPRRSALAFVGEDRLLLRGATPRVVELATAESTPAEGDAAQLAMTDPSGQHRLVAIERRCAGTVLVLGPLDPLADLSSARRTALVAPRRPPPGAPCPDLTPALRADEDGWRALGWAPQGVLVARGTELRVVPLDLEGRAAGEPVELGPGAAIPAPITPGHATADARAYAYATPAGLVVVALEPERRATFVRPPGWTAPEGAPQDVALSPSGRRVAWIAGGRVRWTERAP